jgi:hypothetical protein
MRRPLRFLFRLLLGLPVAAGCHALPPPTPVLVRDAETKTPLAGAKVRLWCANPHAPGLGRDSLGTTGEDGTARVRAATDDHPDVVIAVRADGYLPEETEFRPPAAAVAGEPMVVEVFRGPRPVVDLILPADYHGVVKVEVRVRDDAEPGRRAFTFPVSPQGTVQVVGPAILAHGPGAEFRARFGDGPPLPKTAEGLQTAFWWLRSEGDTHFFVVGTVGEWGSERRAMEKEALLRADGRGQGGQGPQGGGRGGHRRGGGMGGRGGP